jgi:hypothetical protein
MARRTGKAATRRARQQRRARMGSAAPAPPSTASTGPATAGEGDPSPVTPRAPLFATVPVSSRLGENAREEYHYVGRDLRNTAILTLIMAALLAGAVILVNLSGVSPS